MEKAEFEKSANEIIVHPQKPNKTSVEQEKEQKFYNWLTEKMTAWQNRRVNLYLLYDNPVEDYEKFTEIRFPPFMVSDVWMAAVCAATLEDVFKEYKKAYGHKE